MPNLVFILLANPQPIFIIVTTNPPRMYINRKYYRVPDGGSLFECISIEIFNSPNSSQKRQMTEAISDDMRAKTSFDMGNPILD